MAPGIPVFFERQLYALQPPVHVLEGFYPIKESSAHHVLCRHGHKEQPSRFHDSPHFPECLLRPRFKMFHDSQGDHRIE